MRFNCPVRHRWRAFNFWQKQIQTNELDPEFPTDPTHSCYSTRQQCCKRWNRIRSCGTTQKKTLQKRSINDQDHKKNCTQRPVRQTADKKSARVERETNTLHSALLCRWLRKRTPKRRIPTTTTMPRTTQETWEIRQTSKGRRQHRVNRANPSRRRPHRNNFCQSWSKLCSALNGLLCSNINGMSITRINFGRTSAWRLSTYQ